MKVVLVRIKAIRIYYFTNSLCTSVGKFIEKFL